jgi:hypothetical protein
VATSQATGCCGDPSRGHCSAAIAKRVLGDLLGQIHVTKEADQGRQDTAPLALEDLGSAGWCRRVTVRAEWECAAARGDAWDVQHANRFDRVEIRQRPAAPASRVDE